MALLLIERLLVKEYYSAYNYESLSDHYVYPYFLFCSEKEAFLMSIFIKIKQNAKRHTLSCA